MPVLPLPKELARRRTYSEARLTELRAALTALPDVQRHSDLCIYAGGSLGRLEACESSDLDLFFLHSGSEEQETISRVEKILLDAKIIELCRGLGFPDPSNDGQFLQIHYFNRMQDVLGSPRDDFDNLFTARLLLLLEGVALTNDEKYQQVRKEVINTYFRDYHQHVEYFRPIFLINDIIRFWKTLCLNYEHKRNHVDKREAEKNKNHLRNLKLKFSRLMTCYSGVISLGAAERPTTPEMVEHLLSRVPVDRLLAISSEKPHTAALVQSVLAKYDWFLDCVARPSEEMVDWMGDRENRDKAFGEARDFGRAMYDTLELTAKPIFRYIVV